MAAVKMILEDALDYDFTVIAIHCSLEDYRLAFMINKHLGLQLKRSPLDIDYKIDCFNALFPLYSFEDQRNYLNYSLAANKCKIPALETQSDSDLFAESVQKNYRTLYLLQEIKRADYLLKIEADSGIVPQAVLVGRLNKIPQIVTAYQVDVTSLKSKKNLIFE